MSNVYINFDSPNVKFDDSNITFDGMMINVPGPKLRRKYPIRKLLNLYYDIDGSKAFLYTEAYDIIGKVKFVRQFINPVVAQRKFLYKDERRVTSSVKVFLDNSYNLAAKRSYNFLSTTPFLGKRRFICTEDKEIIASRKCEFKSMSDISALLKQSMVSSQPMYGSKRMTHNQNFITKGKKDISNILIGLDLL